VRRSGDQALITKDRLRVDVGVEFYVSVIPDEDAVARASQTLGRRTFQADQLQALKRGAVDLGFIGPAPPDLPEGITVTPWKTEPLHACMPRSHDLAGRKRISIARLSTQSLVTVSHEAAPVYHQWLREQFVQAGVRPLIVQRADRARAVCTMAAVSGHIALLTRSACRNVEGCVSIPVTGKDGKYLTLTHVIATRTNGPEPAQTLLKVLTRS